MAKPRRNPERLMMSPLRQEIPILTLALGTLAGAAIAFAGAAWAWAPPAGWALVVAGLILLVLTLPQTEKPPIHLTLFFFLALTLAYGRAENKIEGIHREMFGWKEASKPHWATARVAAASPTPTGKIKVTLEDITIYNLRGLPHCQSLTLYMNANSFEKAGGKTLIANPTMGLALPLVFSKPQAPAFDGDPDWRWWRFFNRCARASAWGAEATTLPPATPRATSWLENFRQSTIQQTSQNANGVVTALLVGERTAIPPALNKAYQASGLTHLIAISGMQLTLVGGGIFWLIRYLLACVPAIALRWNIKAIAAIAGLAGAGAYTVLAGAQVSVVRAFIMAGFVMGAAIAGRLNSALRALAFATIGIIAVAPEEILNPGFILSISAVAALLVWGTHEHPGRGLLNHLNTTAKATIVAGTATLPAVAFFFHSVSLYSLPANVVGIPLMAAATWAGFATLLTLPLGFGNIPLTLTTWLVEATNIWATALSTLPTPQLWVPQALTPFLAVTCTALVALMTQKKWPIALLLLGILMVELTLVPHLWPSPKIITLEENRAAGFIQNGTVIPLWQEKTHVLNRYAKARFLKLGEPIPPTACDTVGCTYPTPYGQLLRLNEGQDATQEDATQARFIVSTPVPLLR